MALRGPRLLNAAVYLLLCSVAAVSAFEAGGPEGAAGATGALPGGGGRRRLTADGGDAGTVQVKSFCNPLSATALKPIPCTPDQEGDSLTDLFQDTPLDVAEAVIDVSECDPLDPEGFTEPVDPFNTQLIEVANAIGDDFVASMGDGSFWSTECQGDLLPDPFNACKRPELPPAAGEEEAPGTFYKIKMKLACSLLDNEEVALQAYAIFTPTNANETVSAIEWEEIALPPPGQ